MLPYLSADFTLVDWIVDLTTTYLYTGLCPHSGALLQLPRTLGIETIACTLMAELAGDERYRREGKMYGVLLVQAATGEIGFFKAFSGLLNGLDKLSGWVPPIPGREGVVMAETETLADLAAMKQELIALAELPEREEYQRLAAAFGIRLEQQSIEHRQRKESRAQVRS
jgi:tRNA pseudouridine32 synthase / 23S rRNA pseudouridine746 synthase